MNFHFQVLHIAPIKILFQTPKKIVITTHHHPDGDAIGSSLGLYNYLVQRGHHIQVITPSDYPVYLKWMAGNEHVCNYELNKNKADSAVEEADIIFCLDFNRMNRIDKLETKVRQSKAVKILIDHHPEPENAFDHIYSFPESCATSELIYEFIVAMEDSSLINTPVADCLYTGIMTDTQSFRLATMKASTHRIIAKLMEAGADNYKIHELVYDTNTEDRLRLLGLSLKDKLVVLPEFRTAYISLMQQELDRYHHQDGDTEGVVNYALSIKGIRLAAFFSTRDNMVKISFRSKENFSAKELAEKHFEGGGHKYAAGGKSNLAMEDTVKKFVSVLSQYDELKN